MSAKIKCEFCPYTFPDSLSSCPHCARPALFPNVSRAERANEREALSNRYQAAVQGAEKRGCEATVQAFEAEAARSESVIARSYAETLRLATADHNLYSTYYQQLESDLRVPEGSKWDLLRPLTDETLFGNYKKHVRFGALSLDGLGLMNYGECSWVLRDDMIAHRASVFEENSVKFLERHWARLGKTRDLPAGHRATWKERSKLCVAKLANQIDGATTATDFPGMLLKSGPVAEDDDFVEVHIGGSMTVRTFKRVIIHSRARRNAIGKELRRKLELMSVAVEGRTWTH